MKISLFLVALLAALAAADLPPYPWVPNGYVAYHLTDGQHITIDGRLDEEAWVEVGTTAAFGDIQGPFPIPRFNTTVKMRWDDDYLYVGAYMQETHVWANQTQRDSVVYYDNDFEIFIDPDGSTHYYKEFEMNAINTIWALYLTKPYLNGGTPVNYDSLDIKTAVYVDGPVNDPSRPDVFWTAEVAISLKDYAVNTTARTPPQQGDQWRINFSRVEWKVVVVDGNYEKVPHTAEDNWVWSPQYAINMHIPERWGFVLFSKEAVNTTKYETPIDWNIRLGLQNVYLAEAAFSAQNGYYTADFDQLSSFIPDYVFSGQLGITMPDIYLPSSYSFLVTINGTTEATSNLMGTVTDDRYTRVVTV